VSIDELMDVASEPHEFNIYMATNFSTLTQDIANRLLNSFCNSRHFPAIVYHYFVCVYAKTYVIYVSLLSLDMTNTVCCTC